MFQREGKLYFREKEMSGGITWKGSRMKKMIGIMMWKEME